MKILLLIASLMFGLSGCDLFGSSLSADATDSQVVDADTGQPIDGAVVVAHWELHRGSLAGDSLPCGAADVEEAVTDKDGKFHIPGWGPIRSSCDGMRSFSPIFYIFKSGYGYGREGNNPADFTAIVKFTHSDWNDRQIKLQKYPNLDLTQNGVRSYAANFGSLNLYLADFIVNFPVECNWKKIPNTLRALMAQARVFQQAGNRIGSIADEMSGADEAMQRDAPKCGSPKAFIEGLDKGIQK